jgi:hypothetical protein
LIEAQQSAIAPLSRYLRGLDVNIQDLELDQRLLSHASNRDNLKSRLRFVQDGLSRSVSWYKMQLTDRQMTADPELRHLLFELGEIDAARLWRVEAAMALLKISVRGGDKERDDVPQPEPQQQKEEKWRPRLMDDVGRPAWAGSGSRRWSRPSRNRGTKDPNR